MKRKTINSLCIICMLFCCSCLMTNGQSTENKNQIRLIDYSIHRVQPAKPFRYRDADNKVKESKTAYLVLFRLENMPAPAGPILDFFIGDYQIPEHGTTKDGIYFRIYEIALMDKLAKKNVSYQISDQEKVSLNKEFVIPDLKKLPVEDEDKLLKRRQ